jgi:hypothetical protein
MAIRNKLNVPLSPIPYTKEVDGSGDHAGLANSTYFKDLSDGLVYFKDGTGTIISLFESGGGNLGDTNLTLSGATTRTYNLDGNELRFINGATSLFKIHPNTVVVGGGTPIAGTIFLSRGTGNTAGTRNFRTESNNGLNYFEVLDDATTLLKGASTVVSKTIQSTSASGFSSLILNNNIGGLGGYIRHANSTGLFEYTSISSQIFRVADSSHYKFSFAGGGDAFTDMKLDSTGLLLGTGIGATTIGAKLHVIGSTLLNGNLGVFGTTPIAQPTTAQAPAIITPGSGTNVLHDDLFDGYTLAQIAKALRDLGILQ